MPVTVRLYAAARAAVGTSEVTAAAGSIESVVGELEGKYPGIAKLLPICSLLVDGERATGELRDGTVLEVLPPFAGG